MTHLSAAELGQAIEGEPLESVRGHLESCAECRSLVEEMRQVRDTVSALDVPEPSPLFWDHLSSRIRAEIQALPSEVGAGSGRRQWVAVLAAAWRPSWGAVAGVVVVALAATATMVWRSPDGVPALTPVSVSEARKTDPEPSATESPLDSQWELMVEVAVGVELDHTALGLVVGSADRALVELSDDERRELGEWLRQELRSSPGGGTL